MRERADIGFSVLLIVIFGYIFFDSLTLDARSRAFPMAISGPMLLLALWNLARTGYGIYKGVAQETDPTPGPERELSGAERIEALAAAGRVTVDAETTRKRILNILAWMFGSFLLLWLLGFREGLPVFVFLFLWRESKDPLWFATTLAVSTWVILHFFFGYFLNYPWPAPQISLWFGFDWPAI